MSHSNSTANYNLPQFVGTDTPAWLTDVNGAFEDIDSAIANTAMATQEAKQAADAAQGTADSASRVASVLANTTVPALSAKVEDLHEMHLLYDGSGASLAAGTVFTLQDSVQNYREIVIQNPGDNNALDAYRVVNMKKPLTAFTDAVMFMGSSGNVNVRCIYCAVSGNTFSVTYVKHGAYPGALNDIDLGAFKVYGIK